MWKTWTHGPVWAPEDEGATGGDEASGDAAGAESDAGDGGEGAGKPSTILDFATQGEGKSQDGHGEAWKLPEGVELPDHLVGLTAEDTLSKLAKAYSGARRELSTKGKGGQMEGTVPESPDDYAFEPEGEDDKVAAELNSEASKPYVDAFRKAAHKHGVPAEVFTALMREGLAGIAESGIPIGVSNEEASKISGEAEMASLVQEVGKAEASTIVNTISTYGKKLAERGVLQGEDDVSEFAQMVGTARGARIFHRILTGEMGEKPIPVADGVDGSVRPEEAYAKHAAASRMPPGPDKDLAMQEAQRLFQKAFGNGSNQSGSVRSGVL